MKNDPEPPSNSTQLHRNKVEDLSNSTFIANSLKWIIWLLVVFGVTVLFRFAYQIDPSDNHWAIDYTVTMILVSLLPITLAIRLYLIRKIKNLWVKLFTYAFGLFVSELIIICGFFAVLNGDFLLITVGSIMTIIYFPASIKIAQS